MDVVFDWGIFKDQVKAVLAVLAALGIVIDLTPGIKIQPIRWIISWIGKQFNREIYEKLDNLSRDLEMHKLDSWRESILEFANSCMNHRKHTKEEFDHIIAMHDEYERYVKEKKIVNGQVKLAYEYIEKQYKHCCEKNSFLTISNE